MNQTLSNPAFSPRLLQTHFNAAVNADKKQSGNTQPPEKLRTLLVGVHELNRHICVSGDITVCYRFQRSSDLRYAGFLISYRRMRATVQGGPGLHPTVDALEDLLQFLEPSSSPSFVMQTSETIVCGSDVATLAADPAALSRLAITTFLSRTGLSGESLKFVPDESVGQQARVITKHWDLGDFNPRIFNAALEASIGIATIAYAHTPPSTQLYITLYTTIAIAVDDGVSTPEALFAFADRMYCGLPQLHSLLDRFVDVLNDTINHYPAIAAREIIRATFAYMDSTALEFEVTKVPLRPRAFSYVLAKRLANGIGRAYANFVWDKVHFPNYFTFMQAAPDMEMYFDQVNDILSFYKEELVGEKGNFISERGRATNRGTAGALFDTVDDAVTAVQNIRSILEGTKELVACEAAMEGYVAWHRMERRYKLADVLGTK